MSYSEENPIISFRVPKMIFKIFNGHLNVRKESRQEYLYNMFMKNLENKNLLEVSYQVKDE